MKQIETGLPLRGMQDFGAPLGFNRRLRQQELWFDLQSLAACVTKGWSCRTKSCLDAKTGLG